MVTGLLGVWKRGVITIIILRACLARGLILKKVRYRETFNLRGWLGEETAVHQCPIHSRHVQYTDSATTVLFFFPICWWLPLASFYHVTNFFFNMPARQEKFKNLAATAVKTWSIYIYKQKNQEPGHKLWASFRSTAHVTPNSSSCWQPENGKQTRASRQIRTPAYTAVRGSWWRHSLVYSRGHTYLEGDGNLGGIPDGEDAPGLAVGEELEWQRIRRYLYIIIWIYISYVEHALHGSCKHAASMAAG